jgi:hypothetical protein
MNGSASARANKIPWWHFVGRIDRSLRQGEGPNAINPAPRKLPRSAPRKQRPAQDQVERQRPVMALSVSKARKIPELRALDS